MINRKNARPRRELAGRKVLVTRSAEGNSVEKAKLEQHGAEVVEFEAIKINPPSSWAQCDLAIAILDELDWIVFTSANGVRAFFERCDLKPETENVLRKLKNGERLSPKFACVGPATRRMLEEYGFRSSFEPRKFLTNALATELARLEDLRNQNMLLARAEIAAREISEIFEDAGARVIDAPVYRTEPQPMIARDKMQSITDVTLTSPSTVEALVAAVPPDEINSRRILVHCIGPVTAERAKLAGLRIASVAANHTINGLIDSMVQSIMISQREN